MAEITPREQRRRPQEESAWRSPFERDYDRLLYSSYLRRLDNVTQVYPSRSASGLHNRLTHSLKVAQVGRRTAQKLLHEYEQSADRPLLPGMLSSEVLNVAGHLHDFGHPPFGHVAERELQKALAPTYGPVAEEVEKPAAGGEAEAETRPNLNRFWLPDSFEGNAQTFRIVTRLAARKSVEADKNNEGATTDGMGLNATRAVLAAVSKYPWLKGKFSARQGGSHPDWAEYRTKKWGAYDSEEKALEFAMEGLDDRFRSLEAELMDFADDVAYAVHDVEDFFRQGLIPLHEIGANLRQDRSSTIFDEFWAYAVDGLSDQSHLDFDSGSVLRELRRLGDSFPFVPFTGSDADKVQMHRFASDMTDYFQRGLKIDDEYVLTPADNKTAVVEVLKNLTWFFVIENPSLASVQRGQRRVIRELHSWLCEWSMAAYEGASSSNAGRRNARRRRRNLPLRLQELVTVAIDSKAYKSEAQSVSRGVVDFITYLDEEGAVDLHARLNGSRVIPSR